MFCEINLNVIEGCNSLISFILLVVTIYVSWNTYDPLFSQELSDEMLIVANETTFVSGVNEFESVFDDFCNENHAMNMVIRHHNNKFYKGTTIQKTAHISTGPFFTHLMPWFLLYAVLTISGLFQYYRAQYSDRFDILKPYFSRWVEYGLTSPLQILIVCNSLLISNRGIIFNLALLQLALVTLGYLTEKLLFEKSWGEAIYVLIISWLIFACMWWTILARFFLQLSNTERCNIDDETHDVAKFVMWGQFICFGLFGCVQTWQLIFSLLHDDDNDKQSMGMIRVENEQDKNIWFTTSMLYSLLSIISKTILDVTFLLMMNYEQSTIVMK